MFIFMGKNVIIIKSLFSEITFSLHSYFNRLTLFSILQLWNLKYTISVHRELHFWSKEQIVAKHLNIIIALVKFCYQYRYECVTSIFAIPSNAADNNNVSHFIVSVFFLYLYCIVPYKISSGSYNTRIIVIAC